MTARPVQLRDQATIDINRAVDYYMAEAGVDVALRFIDASERTIRQLGRSPQTGNLRFAYLLDIPGLRVRQIIGFPYLVFYRSDDKVVDVWRVLHMRRDVSTAIELNA
jgi:toxin ParE1/3/4